MKELAPDWLRETVNIGAGHAAQALSELLGVRVDIEVPRVYWGSLEEAAEALDGSQEPCVGVNFKVFGDLKGKALLYYPMEEVSSLLRRLGLPESLDDSVSKSAVAESSHIVVGAFLSATADFLGVKALVGVPRLQIFPELGLIRAWLGEGEGEFLGAKVSMRVAEGPITTSLIYSPAAEALELITKKLKEMLS